MSKLRRPKHGPEWYIERQLKQYLRDRNWNVEKMHGNLFQQGIPDLYVRHKQYGHRWIDVKQPEKYSFTRAQKIKWPLWEAFGEGIWILTAANQVEYDKLFDLPNWRNYWKPSYGVIPDVDQLLDELIALEKELEEHDAD